MLESVPQQADREPDTSAPSPASPSKPRAHTPLRTIPSTERLLATGGALLLVFVVLRLGWISDDAFIALRAVQNFVQGHGLVSNPAERVQGFTNPLWVLLLVGPYALTRNAYWSAMLMSLLCTAACAWLIARRWRAGYAAPVTLVLLASSYAFTSFSTSGLENALAHALFAGFVLSGFGEHKWRFHLRAALAGLIVLNRLDHAVLVVPALAADVRVIGLRPALRLAAFGFAPVLLWLCVAILYYGFPFPNTAYAKLNLDLARGQIWMQGLSYLTDAALRDPLLPLVIALGLVSSVRRPLSLQLLAPAIGVAAYLVYVISIGGDFMSGRFLTVPYLVSAMIFAESLRSFPGMGLLALSVAAFLLGLPHIQRMPTDVRPSCHVPPSGIVDERDCYVEHTGIAQNFRNAKHKTHAYYKDGLKWRANGDSVVVTNVVGLTGVGAGAHVHIIDDYGLTDPLLARIPFGGASDWRIGHFRRKIPEGYVDSVKTATNKLTDACLRSLYDDIRLITRGPLFASGRFAAIWRTNFVRRSCPG